MRFKREENGSRLWETAQRLELNSHAGLSFWGGGVCQLENSHIQLQKRENVVAHLADVDVFIFRNVF